MSSVLRRMKVLNATVHGFRSTFRDYIGEETQLELSYKDGIKHGVWELYSNRGQLERTSCYQNDELVDVKYCNL